jgi:hypothetical protein
MTLQTLSIDLEARLAKFTADMGQAARVTERTSAQISKGLSVIKSTAAGLVAGLSVGFFVQLTKGAIDSIDALNDVKDATGASIENLSALEDIAARTGTRFEVVGDTLSKFNKRLVDAKPGTDVAQAFDVLGLSLDELKRKDPAEALRQTAIALAGFADDGRKARLETLIFGEAVKNVAPFMKNLGEAGTLVAKVTTQQAEEAERFNRSLLELQKNTQDFARDLAGPLVAGLNKAISKFKEARDAGAFPFTSMAKEVEKELGRRSANYTGTWYTGNAGRGVVNPDAVRPSVAEITVAPKSPKGDKAAKDIDLTNKALDSYLKTLTLTLERTEGLSEAEKAWAFLRREGAGVSLDDAARVISLANQIDKTREATAAEKDLTEARQRTAQISDAYIAGLSADNDAMVRNNDTLRLQLEELGLNADAVDRLRLARLDAALATERENLVNAKNIEGNEAEIQQIERRIRLKEIERGLVSQTTERRRTVDLEQESADAAKVLNADVKTALSNAFRDSQNPIQSFGAALGNVVYTRLTNAAASGLADILVGSGKPGGSGGLLSGLIGGLGKLFSFDGGGSTGSGLRSGGIDGKGGFLAVMHPQETVYDHTKGQRASGSVTVNLTTNVGDVASMSYVQVAVQRGVQAALAASRRSEVYS